MLNLRYLGNTKSNHGLYEVLLGGNVIGKIDVGSVPASGPERHKELLKRTALFARLREIGLIAA